jgi:AhpC/TSA family
MRAPVDHIAAPRFPAPLPWFNVAPLRMDQQLGRPVLIEFWDFCRPNSIRTLPYMKVWHERYSDAGLRVIGIHASGFEPSADPANVEAAVARLEIPYPVVVDVELEIWSLYGNLGWPARYLFNQEGMLFEYHYGEGAYEETERAIQELLGIEAPTVEPIRPEDAPGALLELQSDDVEGPYSGPYRAGGVWAVLDGHGVVTANGISIDVENPGCYELISHEHSTHGELALDVGEGVRCIAVCFTPGLAE